jgi:hypothetical protein
MGERSYKDEECAEKVRVRVGEGGKCTPCGGVLLLWRRDERGYLGAVE